MGSGRAVGGGEPQQLPKADVWAVFLPPSRVTFPERDASPGRTVPPHGRYAGQPFVAVRSGTSAEVRSKASVEWDIHPRDAHAAAAARLVAMQTRQPDFESAGELPLRGWCARRCACGRRGSGDRGIGVSEMPHPRTSDAGLGAVRARSGRRNAACRTPTRGVRLKLGRDHGRCRAIWECGLDLAVGRGFRTAV